jgi:peptide/nickel transport system permease protein
MVVDRSTVTSPAVPPIAAPTRAQQPARGELQIVLGLLARNRLALVGAGIYLGFVLLAILAPALAPADPQEQNLLDRLKPPAWMAGGTTDHLLGADNLGRDILSRLMNGAQVSLEVAVGVVVLSGVVGIGLGTISGYAAGKVDYFIQKVVEVFWAIPSLIMAIAILTFLGQSLPNLILALCVQRWIYYCRVVRGEALTVRQREFMTAARVIGAGDVRIMLRHLLPNLIPSSLVIATFSMATAIISEASLSFLGLGVPPTIPTWGTMLSDGRNYISTAPWLCIFPGLAIFLVVLGMNLLGDGLRDVLDPRAKKAAGLV